MAKGTSHGMEYNSSWGNLIIPEYGRNIQNMIQVAKTIENDGERQAFIEKVVDLMIQLTPHNRNLEDTRNKMWAHVFRIANYDINVSPPDGVVPTPEKYQVKPFKVDYPVSEPKFRHYGHLVQSLVRKARTLEAGPVKEGFVETIGSYMKLSYKTWNREHYISDEMIIRDLEVLSAGELVTHDDASFDSLSSATSNKKITNTNIIGTSKRTNSRKSSSNRTNSSRNSNSSNTTKRRWKK